MYSTALLYEFSTRRPSIATAHQETANGGEERRRDGCEERREPEAAAHQVELRAHATVTVHQAARHQRPGHEAHSVRHLREGNYLVVRTGRETPTVRILPDCSMKQRFGTFTGVLVQKF